VSCKSKINNERSRFWVHASCEHDINEVFLFLKMVSVIDNTIINDLSDEADRGLGTILIKIWHVQVIEEVDKGLTWRRTECSTSSLINT
jgi:hypothetical protein